MLIRFVRAQLALAAYWTTLSACKRLQFQSQSGTHTVMAMMDDQTERTLDAFRDALREQLGDELTSMVLFGSATGSHFIDEVSDLNVLIVVETASIDTLQTLRSALRDHKQIPIDPIIIAQEEVEDLPESFPIETVDMQSARRVLAGDDPLASLNVDADAIHRQLAAELLGKTMRLRAVYAQAKRGDDKQLRAMLSQTVSPFSSLMRALLYVGDPHFAEFSPPREFLEILAQLEERFGLELEGFRSASLVKSGTETPEGAELTAIFEKVLTEAEALHRLAKTLPQRQEIS